MVLRTSESRWATRLAFVALLFVFSSCGDAPRPGVPPKHVLLITAERVRGDHVTYLGYDRHTTGLLRLDQSEALDLDFLASKGVLFANAQAPSSDDELSLATLATGVFPTPAGEGVWSAAAEARHPTLAEDFEAAGFATGGFFNRASLPADSASAEGLGRGFGRAEFLDSDEEVLTAAVKWLGISVETERPLFTWVHLGGIRKPFEGEPMQDLISVDDYTGPVRASLDFFAELERGDQRLSSTDRRRLNDFYDARLARLTALINSFFFLYRNDIGGNAFWDESLILFAGTSGCELAEFDSRVATRDSLIDAGLHVPLIVAHPPSLTAERIFAPAVELVDVSATLRDWFNLSGEGEGPGRSLLRLTDSYIQRDFPDTGALSVSGRPGGIAGTSLRTDRWRLIERKGSVQLYDLDADPGGLHDLAEARPQLVEELRTRLQQQRAKHGLGQSSRP